MGDYLRATNTQQQALRLFHELSDRFGMMIAHANLGAIALEFDDFGEGKPRVHHGVGLLPPLAAVATTAWRWRSWLRSISKRAWSIRSMSGSRAALTIAQEVGHRDNQGKICSSWGEPHTGWAALPMRAAYEEALTIRRALGQATQAMEVLAGLADVALAEGDVAGALARSMSSCRLWRTEDWRRLLRPIRSITPALRSCVRRMMGGQALSWPMQSTGCTRGVDGGC